MCVGEGRCVWGRVDVCGYVWVCVGMWGKCVDMCREVGVCVSACVVYVCVCVSAYVGGSVCGGRRRECVCGEGGVCMCVILTISEPIYLKRQA